MLKTTPLGDSALILHVADRLDPDPRRTLSAVLGCLEKLRAAGLPGVVETLPACTSIGVHFDPVAAVAAGAPGGDVFGWMSAAAIGACGGAKAKLSAKLKPRTVQIPVCYESEFAPDLAAVAEHAAMTKDDVIRLHSGAEYRVQCLGFSPGFPYLAGLPDALATPRRAQPRICVPAGAVGIGGAQTGVYPQASPGGWNIIGRTPRRLFDPAAGEPALLRAGDIVRFIPIAREAFEPEPR